MASIKADINKGRLAVRRAYSSSDIVVLTVTFMVFFFVTSAYFIVAFLIEEGPRYSSQPRMLLAGVLGALMGGAILFVILLLLGMFVIRMQRQTMLGNSLQVEYSDYAWLRDWANQVSADLEMPRTEILVTQDPLINAYAFGFIRPYNIILNSGSVRYLTKDELKVVVVHEMAHIKYGHTKALLYLQPFMSIPVVGVIFSWLGGFWKRRAEYTADRLALMYMENSELVKNSLVKVHVGPDVAESMNETARQWLQYTSDRPMNRFAQTFSGHPFLVRRISHIDRWKSIVEAK